MAHMLGRVLTALRLTRVSEGFGAVCDIWLIAVLAGADWAGVAAGTASLDVLQLLLTLLGALMVAIGLFGYGSVLNDLMDVQHDRAFSPGRPIPHGDIRVPQAVVGLLGLFIIAILGAMMLGRDSVYLTLVVAAALLFYNGTGRFIPAVGVVTVGLVYAVHMLIPDYQTPLLIAVWLSMSHVMILAVLVHLLEDKRPRLTGRGVGGIVCGWVFWSAVILLARPFRGDELWPADLPPLAILWPCAAMGSMAIVGWWKIRTAPSGGVASERLKRYGAAWHAAYAAAWCAALGLWIPAMGFVLLGLIGFVVMTVLKELARVGPGPLAYR